MAHGTHLTAVHRAAVQRPWTPPELQNLKWVNIERVAWKTGPRFFSQRFEHISWSFWRYKSKQSVTSVIGVQFEQFKHCKHTQ